MMEPRSPDDSTRPGSARPAGESPRYPVNHVVGVLETREQVESAVNALLAGGFLDSEIEVATGQASADALDATTGRSGLAHLAIRVAEKLGLSSEEMDLKERYEEALRAGRFVVAVLAPSDARKERAVQILKDHGCGAVHFLGRFTIESLRR